MFVLASDVAGWFNRISIWGGIANVFTAFVEEVLEMLVFRICKNGCNDESSLCIYISNHSDWLDVFTVLLTWYILGCDKINVQRHGEKECNTINKHYINTECDMFILF